MSDDPTVFTDGEPLDEADDDDTCPQCGGEGGYASCIEDCCPYEGGEDECDDPLCWKVCACCKGTPRHD